MGDPAPSQSQLDTQSIQKKGRGCTRMKQLKRKTADGQKLPIEFQPNGLPSGKNAKDFKLSVAAAARMNASILISDWDSKIASVTEAKANVWKAITVRNILFCLSLLY